MNDPRWEKVSAFTTWASADRETLDPSEYRRRFADYNATLEEIATDDGLPIAERSEARARLDRVQAAARMHFAEAVRRLAETAADESLPSKLRADAKQELRQLADQMRADGTDLGNWIEAPSRTPQ